MWEEEDIDQAGERAGERLDFQKHPEACSLLLQDPWSLALLLGHLWFFLSALFVVVPMVIFLHCSVAVHCISTEVPT